MNDITGIRQVDTGSFPEIYNQFHAKVFRYFLKRVSRHETATELTQQLFIKLWQSRNTLSNVHSLEVQLFTMANSVWIDYLRKEATKKKYYSTVAEFGPIHETGQDQTAFHAMEASDCFQQAMHQLPPVRKKVFMLKIWHGFSNQEIAGRLSVSVKTVEDHLWKAMRHIRSMLTTVAVFLSILS